MTVWKFRALVPALVAVLLGSGCTIMAPHYSPSMPNVQALKSAGDSKVKVGKVEFDKAASSAASISLRGSRLVSPYGRSYANYLAEAIRTELELAGRLAPGSAVEISALMLKNSIDAAGFVNGYGEIAARFSVKRNGGLLYEADKRVTTQWDSNFAGAIAIPSAQLAYPRLVQALLTELYADPAFLAALK